MAIIFAPFAQLGISQTILKFLPELKKNNPIAANSFFTFSVIIGTTGFLIFSVLFFLFYDSISSLFIERAPAILEYLYLVLLLTFIIVLFEILVAFSKANLNLVLPSYLREINTRFLVFVSIIIYSLRWIDFDTYLYLIIGIYFLNTLILFIFLISKGYIKDHVKRIDWKSYDLITLLKYGAFTILGAGGALIIGKVDSVMVSAMLGLYENGIYTTAFFMAVVIEIPKRMVSQISMPVISNALVNKDLKLVSSIYSKTALNQLILGLFLLIGIWANIDNIYTFIPNNEIFRLGKYVVLIVGIGKLIDMSAGSNGEVIVMSEHYKVNIYLILMMAVLTIVLNYLLIPIYGVNGAAYGSAIAYLIFNFSKYLFLKRKLGIDPFSYRNLIVLLIGVSVLFIAQWIPMIINPLVDILIQSLIISVLYIGSVYVLNLSEEFNNTLRNLLKLRL